MTTIAAASILIPYPETALPPHLHITVGPCILRVTAGDAGSWVQGRYHDPSGKMPLHISDNGPVTRVALANEPEELLGLLDGLPALDLALGTAQPFALTVTAGAGEATLELGGVPLSALTVRHGAGKATLSFSGPNPAEMSQLQWSVGAGAVEARGLGNANFSEMFIEGGAAGLRLFFDGIPRHEARVRITTALAGVELYIPAVVPAEVTSTSWLGGTEADAGFDRQGDLYRTPAARAG
jgi:hypothetical protein